MATTAPTIFTFRVHFDDGSKVDIEAETPQEAGKRAASARAPTQSRIVAKIKQVRSDEVGKADRPSGGVARPAGAAAAVGGEQPREAKP